MAGHSKWANIKHRKGAQDAKRGKIFTKLIREITVAARMGGPDQDSNPRLRDALMKALKANMKRDTIENAIKRGTGDQDGADMMEMTYEGYGPSGVAVLVDCLSDNKNRTVSEVRHVFTKCGGNLGTDGSVSYLFSKKGQLTFSSNYEEELLMEAALEAGAEDFIVENEGFTVLIDSQEYHAVLSALIKAGFEPEDNELIMLPSTSVDLDEANAEKLIRMIDLLEDLDDVQQVHSNAEISDEVIAAL
jgi:YebC/PmpR family DNA-binding regulatory protein